MATASDSRARTGVGYGSAGARCAGKARPTRSRHSVLAVLLACAALAGSLLACSRPQPSPQAETPEPAIPPRSNLLLITIDTLRADHLSTYGYERTTSPVLDELAADGVRFDRAIVQWPKTGPSFASIFTATYSKDNGLVRKVGVPVPLEYVMLAEALAGQGYQTAAVVANGALAREFHFDQGFDQYIETWKIDTSGEAAPQGARPYAERPFFRGGDVTGAERVTDEALALAAHLDPERPFFLWVHYLDPHFPYSPPEPYADHFVGDEHYDPTVKIDIDASSAHKQMTGIGRESVLDGHDELAFYVARYDAEIYYTDTEIGRLLDGLEKGGLLDATLTAVTADHGESLGDHYYYFDHGRFGFQTCLRVPLIVHYPGVLPTRVDSEPVELLDLAPTLLDFAGVELDAGVWKQGRSLRRRLLEVGAHPAERLAFSEAGYGLNGNWQRIVQDQRYKLILARATAAQRWLGGKGQRWVLYDLQEDPGETVNVVREHPEAADRLRKELVAWLNAEPYPMGASVSEEEGEMDETTRKQLEALGYLQ